jgi:hypothetical protein
MGIERIGRTIGLTLVLAACGCGLDDPGGAAGSSGGSGAGGTANGTADGGSGTGGSAETGGASGTGGGGGTDQDASTGGSTAADGSTAGDANDSGPDADTAPECVVDGNCPGANQACLAGICREKCAPWLNPCDWAPSGDICLNGYCVECSQTSDCPGTRYTCDMASHTCKDKPFDPSKTKIGVFYHTWHCPSSQDVHDVSKCLAGQEAWPPWPSDPNAQTPFWWGEPAGGYYCLTNNTALLTQHAEMLRDMGADFVFVDVTNHNYNTSTLCAAPEAMIIEPFTTLVNVWKSIPGAPKLVPWVPVSDCPTYLPPSACNQPDNTYMVYSMLDLLAGTGMAFEYQGKPLLLITENSIYPASDARLAALSSNYTIRKMWAFEPDGTEKWSYLENCNESPLEGQPCNQRIAVKNGAGEQFPIATAYGADYMSHTNTATPKHYGKTLRKQFETLLDNPEIPIATITGWNEWLTGRWPCGSPACDCSNAFDSTYGCFLDQFTDEYNRDIEPANNATGDYYYRLVQSCISLFRAGKRCTPDNANDLCCGDYTGPK